jgi:hypothetical protein
MSVPRRARRLDLRAHHLLCLHGFRGLGYSPEFVTNMQQVVEALSRDAVLVEVGLGPDVICQPCPHLVDRPPCADPAGTARDRLVLAALEVSPGTVKPWREWQERVAGRISPARLTEICEDCSWFPAGYCRAGLEALRERKRRKHKCEQMRRR